MKGNFLLSLFAFSLAVFAYVERRTAPPPLPVAQEASSEPLFALQPEEIDAIRVVDQKGCVVVRKKGEQQQRAEELINNILQTRVLRRFLPSAGDFSLYGLAQPVRRVEVVRVNGGQSQTVVIGNLNPVGDAVYIRTPEDSEVLLVGSYFLTSLNMALQGLRAEGSQFIDPSCSDRL